MNKNHSFRSDDMYDSDNAFRGLLWGVLLSVPIWALVISLVVVLTSN